MFSVVIPVYNHERYLDEAVASALADPLVKEILLADDGSRDNSLALIEELAARYHNRVQNLTQYPVANIGAHAMLNRLTQAASQPWVAVLNSDDAFIPGRFAAVRNLHRLHRFDFCFGNLAIVDAESSVIGRKRAHKDPQYPFPAVAGLTDTNDGLLLRMLSQNYIATTSNMVFTRKIFDAVGGFRNYRYAHDWDFAIRCMVLGKACYVPDFLTRYRVHGSNTIKEARDKQDQEVRELFATLDKDLGIFSLPGARPFLNSNDYLD